MPLQGFIICESLTSPQIGLQLRERVVYGLPSGPPGSESWSHRRRRRRRSSSELRDQEANLRGEAMLSTLPSWASFPSDFLSQGNQ
jgi:hypothetical protein